MTIERSISVEILRQFVSATESKSFSDAGEREGVSKQAVTKAVQRVEKHVGKTLFDRCSGHEAIATAEAIDLAGECKKVIDDYDHLQRRFAQMQAGRTPIRIAGYPVHLERAVLPTQISEGPFDLDLTRIRQQRARGIGRTLAEELNAGIVDLVFGPELETTRSFQKKRLYTTTIRIASQRIASNSTPADHADEWILTAPPAFQSRRQVDSCFDRAKLRPQIRLESSRPSTLLRGADAGIGTALLPDHYSEASERNLPALLMPDTFAPIETVVFAFWNLGVGPEVERFINALPAE